MPVESLDGGNRVHYPARTIYRYDPVLFEMLVTFARAPVLTTKLEEAWQDAEPID